MKEAYHCIRHEAQAAYDQKTVVESAHGHLLKEIV
jgi:hypothetical protein